MTAYLYTPLVWEWYRLHAEVTGIYLLARRIIKLETIPLTSPYVTGLEVGECHFVRDTALVNGLANELGEVVIPVLL